MSTIMFKQLRRHFDPTDEELIAYLKNKIMNFPLPESMIPEATIYGPGQKLNPWEKLCSNSKDNPYPWQRGMDNMGIEANHDQLFVFSKVTNVGKKTGDFQKSRVAGDGTWHGNNKIDVICQRRKVRIGFSKLLTFQLNNGKETVGHWTMNEYSIDPASYDGLPASDWVLCKIKMHHGKTSVAGKVIKSTKKEEESCQSKSKKRRQILGNGDREVLHHVVVPLMNSHNRDLHPHPHQGVVVSLDEQTLDHQVAESFGDLNFDVPDEWLPEAYSNEGFAGMNITCTVDQVPAPDELMQNEVAKELSNMDFDLDDELRGITGVFGFPAPPSEDARDITDEDFEEMFLGV